MQYNKAMLTLAILAISLFSCKNNDDDTSAEMCSDEVFPESVYQVIDTDLGEVSGLIRTEDNHFVTLGNSHVNGASSDFQLTKFDGDLNVLWTEEYGESGDNFASSLISTQDGGFLLCGSTRNFTEGGLEVYIVKTDADGQEEWSKSYGTSSAERGNAVVQLEDESYLIVGYSVTGGATSTDEYLIRIDKDGNEIWSQINDYAFKDQAVDIKRTSDNHVVVLTASTATNGLELDMILTKFDDEGNVVWQKNLGSTPEVFISYEIIITSDNQFLVGANASAEGSDPFDTDLMIIKLDEAGETLWSRTLSSENRENFKSIIETTENDFLILGDGTTCSGSLSDIYITKINADGDLKWQKSYGGSLYEASSKIIESNANEFIITGHIEGVSTTQDFDLIMFKVDQNGGPK